ncbi:unnamed protein product [Allacma fusca]|uniref:Uncharacterized protein n=1 Tax=Allacma fusca TaxID=39272 RepID=A0A8J2JLI6_9HEXA|nr:unnamed protein product [Allacma fusca]
MYKVGFIVTALSLGIGSSSLILGVVYLIGVVGTEEPEFSNVTCGEKHGTHEGVFHTFEKQWQCDYLDAELVAGSLTTSAGLMQILACITLLIKQRPWICRDSRAVEHIWMSIDFLLCFFAVFITSQERKKASVAVRKIENKIRRGSERRSNDVRRSESWKKSPLAHPPNPASKEKARLKNKNKGGAKSQGSSSTPQTPQSSKTIIQSQAFGRS